MVLEWGTARTLEKHSKRALGLREAKQRQYKHLLECSTRLRHDGEETNFICHYGNQLLETTTPGCDFTNIKLIAENL